MHRRLILTLLLVSCFPQSLSAQLLQGDWVNESQRRIHELRKSDIRIIVFGPDGKSAPDAAVAITQLRHDFPLGFVVHEPEEIDALRDDAPVLRVFNAVALDGLTNWAKIEPAPGQRDLAAVRRAISAAHDRKLHVRWGGVLSGDAGLLPEWAAALEGETFAAAVDAHAAAVAAEAPLVASADLLTHTLGTNTATARLRRTGVRRLFHAMHAAAPEMQLLIRAEDALLEQRVPDLLQRVRAMSEAFVPVDGVALEQRVGGILAQQPVDRAFRLLDTLDVPVTFASLEIGGSSESAAAVNLETFLRVAFASPRVAGIFLAGLHVEDVGDPAAALLAPGDSGGLPTDPGRMLDNLFRKLWWTDEEFVADELGNANARVFAGVHRITATVAGQTAELVVHVPLAAPDEEQLIVLLEVGR